MSCSIRKAIMKAWKRSPYDRDAAPTSEIITNILRNAATRNPLLDEIRAEYYLGAREANVRLYRNEGHFMDVPVTITADLVECLECIAFDIASASQDAWDSNDGLDSNKQENLFGKPEPVIKPDLVVGKTLMDQYSMGRDPAYYDKKVRVSAKAWSRLFAVVDYFTHRNLEVAFYGYLKVKEDHILLENVDVPVQSVFPTTYNIPAGSIFDMPDAEDINCMIHSHANMSVFYSGTDAGDFLKEQKLCGKGRIYASIVINKQREWYGKIYIGDTKEVFKLKFVKPKFEENPFVKEILPRVKGGFNGI